MIKPALDRAWETFLRIPNPLVADEAPAADDAHLTARGIDPASPVVLKLLRDHVLPLVRSMESNGMIDWYAFLIHDSASGVPAPTTDKSLYIHLRFSATPEAAEFDFTTMSHPWEMTHRQALSDRIAGVDAAALGGDIAIAWQILGEQSAWLLRLVELHSDGVDGLQLVRHARQFLHFFANMAQMRVA